MKAGGASIGARPHFVEMNGLRGAQQRTMSTGLPVRSFSEGGRENTSDGSCQKLINMKRIILINGKNPLEKTGGYQTYTASLGKMLIEIGYEVKIICFGKKAAVIKTEIGELHILTSPFYTISLIRSRELAGLALLAPQMAAYIKKILKKDDIIFGIGPWSFAAILHRLLHRVKNNPILSYFPTTFNHEYKAAIKAVRIEDYGTLEKLKTIFIYFTVVNFNALLELLVVRHSDFIINHYQSIQSILQRQFTADPKKFIQLPYCVELSQKKHKQATPTQPFAKPFILLICRHDARKGINFLLHAFAELNAKKIPYSAAIIGDGPLLQKNKMLANKLQLTNVIVAGFVPDPSTYLKNASIYVFPSVEEGSSSISILEAMKQGLPIVSTDVDGIPEDLTDKKSAFLVKPYSSKVLAEAMEVLLKNPDIAKKLGAAAKQAFIKKHDREETKKAFRDLLSKI